MTKIDKLRSMIRKEIIREALKRKIVYRDGKRKEKWISTKDGYKVVYKNGKPKEVRMSAKERRNRSRASKRSSRKKGSGTTRRSNRKRKRTLKKKR